MTSTTTNSVGVSLTVLLLALCSVGDSTDSVGWLVLPVFTGGTATSITAFCS